MEVGHASLRHFPSTGISIFCLTILLLLCPSAGKQCGNCGSTAVPYPLSTSPGCGDPNYPVFCNTSAGALFLRSINQTHYPIRSIDPQSQTFIIQPAELVGTSCRTTDSVYEGLKLNHSLPFTFTADTTIFLLNCSVGFMNRGLLECSNQSNSTSRCWTYLKQAPQEMASCRNSNMICCSAQGGGSVLSYSIIAKSCTAYRGYVNPNLQVPINGWREGLQVQWGSPPELECRNQTDCSEAVPKSTCLPDKGAGGSGTMRCMCNDGLQWDPKTGTCTKVTKECGKGWKCHKAGYTVLVTGIALSLMFIGFRLHKRKRLAQEGRERLRKEREQTLSVNSGGRSAKLFSGRDMIIT